MKPLLITKEKHLIKIENQELNKFLRYDLKLKQMQRQDKKGNWICVKHQYAFFSNYNIYHLECSEEKFKKLIHFTQKLNPFCKSVSTFISRLDEALIYENYFEHGLKTECEVRRGSYGSLYRRVLSKPVEFYSKNTIKFFKEIEIEITSRLEALFIADKQFMEKFIAVLDSCDITLTQKKEFFNLKANRTHSMDNVQVLVERYNYDLKSLIHYLYNYLLPFENLSASQGISELEDYYRMAFQIGRNVKKYPKYLRSMHDIITANYNAHKREYDELLFEKLKKTELECEEKDFCVVVPQCSKDIISEGTTLNHCVGSYVDKVLRQEVYIFFLRKKGEEDISLVTLELVGDKITQAKGSYNRALLEKERTFLQSYSKKLNLVLEA